MPANGSARSVYSTASHLLSPRSTDSSSPTPVRSRSASSSRTNTSQLSPRLPSSSLYPSSRPSNGTDSRSSATRRKRSRAAKGAIRPRNIPRCSSSPVGALVRRRHAYGDSSIASTPPSLSPSSRRSHPVLPLAQGVARPPRPSFLRAAPSSRHGFPLHAPSLFTEANEGYLRSVPRESHDNHGGEQSSSNHGHDRLNEIIMAIDVDKDGKIGCAYYVAMDEELVLEEEVSMGGIEAVDTIMLQVQPTSIIIPNRSPGDLIDFLERDAQRFDDSEGSGGEQGSYILRHVVSVQFDYEAGKEALARLDLEPSTPGAVEILSLEEEHSRAVGPSIHGRLMRIAEKINLESCLSVGCAGAVLQDLERRRTAEDLPDGEEGTIPFVVRSVRMNTSADAMLMSADSLISLQILQSELHPNPHTRSSNSSEPKAKEALSITGLLQALASSAQGKRRLRQMLLRPSTDIDMIRERHRSIAVLLRAENSETVKNMRKQLRKLKNAKTLLLHVKKGVDRIRGQLSIRVGDWKALLRFSMVSAQLRQATDALKGASEIAIFSRICNDIDVKGFLHLGDIILRTIDFQTSKESGRTEILPEASEYLDGLRQEFADVLHVLPDLKESVVQDVPRDAGKHIRHCTVMPQLGFLIAVALHPETGEGVYHGQHHIKGEWKMCFVSEDVAYYKNHLMLDLDSQYGDLPSRIAGLSQHDAPLADESHQLTTKLDEEIEVIMALAAAVLEHEEAILQASELFGELDSLLALALAAEKYNWTAPTMTASNAIDIVDGRHPLQELLAPSYIPNSCYLAGGCGTDGVDEEDPTATNCNGKGAAPSMLILTGPNNSGKSVYMKQVALIVYLSHTGSYVPATRATIGVTDRILTRIATRETVVSDESAFMVDLKQAAFSMNFATRRSLLLIDEFGKGTTAESGSALFAAYLTYLLDLGVDRPKVLAGTHFHDIFENGLLRSEGNVALGHLDVRLEAQAEDPEDQITFLFHLLPGRGPSSLGVLCAAINDVPSDVIKRAEAIVALQDNNESLVEVCSDLSEEDRERLGQAELVARKFLALQVPGKAREQGQDGSIRDLLQSVLPVEELGTPAL